MGGNRVEARCRLETISKSSLAGDTNDKATNRTRKEQDRLTVGCVGTYSANPRQGIGARLRQGNTRSQSLSENGRAEDGAAKVSAVKIAGYRHG